MPFTNVGRGGGVVNVRPPAPRPAAPPLRVQSNPDNQARAAYPPPPPPPHAASSPAYSASANHLAQVMAQARGSSGHPEGGPTAAVGRGPIVPRGGQSYQANATEGALIQRLLKGQIDQSVGRYSPFSSGLGPLALPVGSGRTAIEKLQVLDQFNRDFANLKASGLLPKGAKLPSVAFSGGDSLSGRSWTQGSTIHLSPFERALVASGPGQGAPGNAKSWAETGLIHELAHTMQPQSMRTSAALKGPEGRALVEGGAQAYADAATPAVYGPLPPQDTSYANFVRSVRSRGPSYYMRRQFQQPRQGR